MEDLQKGRRSSGLILDLRNNPGGLLRAAVEVSNLFLDEGRHRQHQGPQPARKKSTTPRPTGPC